MFKNIVLAHYSPTGATRQAALYLAQSLSANVQELDITKQDLNHHDFTDTDTIIFAAPVFGGRLPIQMVENIKQLHAHHTKAIIVTVYGNRAYEDALLELSDCVTAQGFDIIAAATLIAEHSMLRTVAAGRPDKNDHKQIVEFAVQIASKLDSDKPPVLPGNRPYRACSPMPLKIEVSDTCIQCGLCAQQCPTNSISADDPKAFANDKCSICMRCIAICPVQARSLPPAAQKMIAEKLGALHNVHRDNELFL